EEQYRRQQQVARRKRRRTQLALLGARPQPHGSHCRGREPNVANSSTQEKTHAYHPPSITARPNLRARQDCLNPSAPGHHANKRLGTPAQSTATHTDRISSPWRSVVASRHPRKTRRSAREFPPSESPDTGSYWHMPRSRCTFDR